MKNVTNENSEYLKHNIESRNNIEKIDGHNEVNERKSKLANSRAIARTLRKMYARKVEKNWNVRQGFYIRENVVKYYFQDTLSRVHECLVNRIK